MVLTYEVLALLDDRRNPPARVAEDQDHFEHYVVRVCTRALSLSKVSFLLYVHALGC